MDELEPEVALTSEQREGILAWCEAVRTDPHPSCVWPIFVECINAQVSLDPALIDLAEVGVSLLAAND
jgi:hypothetical protein